METASNSTSKRLKLPLKNANNTQVLLTEEVAKTIPGLRPEAPEDPMAYVKFFVAGHRWYVTEMCPLTGMCNGFVTEAPEDRHQWEYGPFSVVELASLLVRPGIAVERDLYFKPALMSEIVALAG